MLLDGLPLSVPDYARIDLARPWKLQPSDPALGSPLSLKVGGERILFISAVYFEFSTSATVASRVCQLLYTDESGLNVAQITANGTVTASQNVFLTFSTGVTTALFVTPYFMSPIAPIMMMPGMQLNVSVSAEQAGDNIKNVRMIGVEIPTGPEVGSGTFGEPDSFVTYPVDVAA